MEQWAKEGSRDSEHMAGLVSQSRRKSRDMHLVALGQGTDTVVVSTLSHMSKCTQSRTEHMGSQSWGSRGARRIRGLGWQCSHPGQRQGFGTCTREPCFPSPGLVMGLVLDNCWTGTWPDSADVSCLERLGLFSANLQSLINQPPVGLAGQSG